MEPVIQLTSAFFAWADRDYKTQAKYDATGYIDDPRAIRLAEVITNDLGISEVRPLGGGSFGIAASTSEEGGDVIKITLDQTEVESGTVLTNTKDDVYPGNVVRVQGAWYVRKLRILAESWFDPDADEWHYAKKRIGLLRMERVRSLDEYADAAALQGLSEYTRFVKNEKKLWAFQTRKLSRAAARARYLHGGEQLESLLKATSEALQRDSQPGWQIPRDVSQAIVQLRALGIYGIDFHGGNIGWVPAGASAREASQPSMPLPPWKSSQQRGYTEETLTHRGIRFTVFGGPALGYRAIILDPIVPSFGIPPAGMMNRTEAIEWAKGEIDRVIANTPPPYVGDKVYKVFDVGMSSAGPVAPKPVEIGRVKEDPEPYSRPILARSVTVAEIG